MPNYGKPMAGICVATALYLCGVTGYPVAPAELPLAEESMTTAGNTVSTFSPGDTFEVTGDGFQNGAAVTISIYSEPRLLSEVVAGTDGTIAAMVTIPSDSPIGDHTISAIGLSPSGNARVLALQITVSPSGSLPLTGFDTLRVMLVATGLLILGFVLIRSTVFGRRLLPKSGETAPVGPAE